MSSVGQILDTSVFSRKTNSKGEGSVLVLGSIVKSFDKDVQSCKAAWVHTLRPEFRNLMNTGITEDTRARLLVAKQVNDAGRKKYEEFKLCKYMDIYMMMAENEIDRGFIRTGAFLSCIDGSEVKALAIIVALQLISECQSDLKYVVYPHDPHSLFDLALYFAARFHSLDVYSLRWICDTRLSLILKNMHDKPLDTACLASTTSIVKNKVAREHLADEWYRLARGKSISGQWNYMDYVSKTIGSTYLPQGKQEGVDGKPGIEARISRRKARRMDKLKKGILKLRDNPSIKPGIAGLIGERLVPWIQDYGRFECSSRITAEELRGKRYVYVALHFQPENTTSCLGGNYVNQIEFLRRIRSVVPQEVTILIKDNPLNKSKKAYTRPCNYVEYVEAMIPNSEFAPITTLSRDLIEFADCTFAVTGTACLESCMAGTPAVYGGRTIFVDLPFAKRIEEIESIRDFESWKDSIKSREDLKDKIQEFFRKKSSEIFEYVAYPTLDGGPGDAHEVWQQIEREWHAGTRVK